ncbi:hypothetical protein [Streptomyces sp. ODS05-4]|uniref:hypothetical protein n=1 Tax=Streptomyces sp. ODS05-4 TaxID=2944939 RepID=UPI002109AE18|nr:hypothetical protein [Streptomyces sp. ODS05-4]
MAERDERLIHGLADGGAEVSVVLRLRWDDIAALGREASKLAEQRGVPVSLDDAVSHRLRTWSSVVAAGAPEERARSREPDRAHERARAAASPAPAPSAPSSAPVGGVGGAGRTPVLPPAGGPAEHPAHAAGRLGGGAPAGVAAGAGLQHAR